MWLLGLATFSVLLTNSNYYSFGNEYFLVTSTIFLVCSSKSLIQSKIYLIIIALILIVYLYQIYVGVNQYIGVHPGNDVSLSINGTLENSGVYACYLILHLPLINFIRAKLTNTNKSFEILGLFFFILILAVVICLVTLTKSRTAYFASCILGLGWAILKYSKSVTNLIKYKLKFLILSTVICLGVSFAILRYLFYIKKMSAIGRLLKIDITLSHFFEHFWTGTGLGRFTWYYPQWQAEYFNKGNFSLDYYLSAGESFIIFNEYLQWFMTVGFWGSAITIIILIYFFKAKSSTHETTINTLKLTVIAILTFGFTSYPLHVNSFLLILGFSIALVFNLSKTVRIFHFGYLVEIKKSTLSSLLGIIYIIVALFFIIAAGKAAKTYHAANLWRNARDMSNVRTSVAQYTRLYKNLKNDGKFLTDYGNLLLQDSSMSENAVKVLQNAKKNFIASASVELLAKAYEENGELQKAITEQEWLCQFLPNKFSTKLKLLKMYVAFDDTSGVQRTAKGILKMPIKVPSLEVEQVLYEAEQILTDYEK
ncbi:O-antigen ligase family protein [Niabella sp. 22666]|uniref:O-antigen ligase family protein n=1 Tax=Niabella sp. 22666 TaxID=3453954 RepID=UPI003F86EC6B